MALMQRHGRAFLPCLTLVIGLSSLLTLSAGEQRPRPTGTSPESQAAPQAPASASPLSAMADEVAFEVEQLRGWKFRRPVRREQVDAAGVHRYLENQLRVALPAARREMLTAFLKTAGLIPATCDPVATALEALDQQVAGYYDPARETLYLVTRPDPMPQFMQRAVLAHELTHALDDQQVGLARLTDSREERTEDREVVLSSLGEGSATSLMFSFLVKEATAGRVNALELGAFATRELERAKVLERVPPYFSAMFGSYLIGAAFLGKGDLQDVLRLPDNKGIGENFRTAWATPPRSSEQVLHPAKYWDEAQRDEPVEVDDRSVEKWLRRPGRQVVHRNTIGELLTAVLTQPRNTRRDASALLSAAAWTNPGAIGWGGDRFYLLASGETPGQAARDLRDLQGVWVTAWDSSSERDEFARTLAQGNPPPGYALETSGERMAILFMGFEAGEREHLTRALAASPLSMTRAGRAWTTR